MKKFINKYKYRLALTGLSLVVMIIVYILGSLSLSNKSNGVIYQYNGETYDVIGYEGDSEVVKIRTKYKGEYVTRISNNAFENEKTIKKIVLPDNLKVIEKEAFYNCENLSEMDLPNTLEEIQSRAFSNTKLYDLVFPEKVKVLNPGVLVNSTVDKVIVIPESIEVIGDSVFIFNELIEEVILPKSLKRIENFAFSYCKNLKKINLPENLEYIGKNAFDATAIEKIEIPANIEVIEESTFRGCSELKEVVLNEGLKIIKDNSFSGCRSLKSINLPSSLEVIKSYAFSNAGFEKLIIPNTVLKVEKYVLQYCNNLKELHVPYLGSDKDDISGINHFFSGDYQAYNDSKSLEIVWVTGENAVIREGAFEYNKTVRKVHFETAVKLSTGIFTSCELIEKVYLGNNLKEVSEYALSKGRNVEKLDVYCPFSQEYAESRFQENWYTSKVNVVYEYNNSK